MPITRSRRRWTACRTGRPGLGSSWSASGGRASTAVCWACSAATSAWSFSSDMPIGPARRPFTNWVMTGLSLVSSASRGPKVISPPRNSMPMLSGTVRAIWMSCVTISIVASISAFRSMSSWDR